MSSKATLIAELHTLFDARIVQVSKAKDATVDHLLRAQAMKDAFMAAAAAQSDDFFAQLGNVNAALVAIKPLVVVPC